MRESGEDFFETGVVVGAHGLGGMLKVASLSGEKTHFLTLRSVVLRKGDVEKNFAVESIAEVPSGVLMRLEGVSTVDEAKSWIGAAIVVPREFACPVREGEFYVEDLKRCRLFFGDEIVGEVRDAVEGGGGFLLDVEVGAEFAAAHFGAVVGRVFIPFRDEFVGDVDLENGAIALRNLRIFESV